MKEEYIYYEDKSRYATVRTWQYVLAFFAIAELACALMLVFWVNFKVDNSVPKCNHGITPEEYRFRRYVELRNQQPDKQEYFQSHK